ncbi:MAG: hypothetical protein IJT66_05895 [Clostridia bacterium]|nr:hypothetical protein [Clostridia bacterium]
MKIIKNAFIALLIGAILFSSLLSAAALSWNGSSAGGGGGGTAAKVNGYAVRTTGDNCIGYRFSIVNKTGANKVSKVIDVFRNTTYGNAQYSAGYKFTSKYNKKQIKDNQDGNFSTSKNSTNCYKETDMKFASTLPVPSGMGTWQTNNTNLNKVLDKLGAGSISSMKNGDKILVEPIYDVKIEKVYHAVTVSEIALYGKHLLGKDSDGGSSGNSGSWGFISDYVNKVYPNALYTKDGMSLWTNASALTSRATFYNIINKGYGVGIAYNETKSDFSPALSVVKCEAWPGTVSTRNSNHYGISMGNAFSNWEYGHGYPKSGDRIWFAVNFGSESENCYVKQTVWVVGGGSTSRNVWSNGNTWYDVSLNPATVPNNASYYTVKARADWIESNGTVKKTGAEKTFYIPIKPVVTREKVTAFNQEGTVQAYSGNTGGSGKVYFGQKVTFQYGYGAATTWDSSNNLTGTASRWNGSSWAKSYTGRTDGNDVYQTNVVLSNTKSCTRNSGIGTYTIPLPAKEDANSYKLKFDLTTAWASDTAHTTENNTYYIPVVKSDVALADIKLVDSEGYYVDHEDLTVGDAVTVHYIYKNNTDCTVYVKGYNDDGSQISGVYAIPAGETVEVAGADFTVPSKRSFSIGGSVYLDTVAKGNTAYETNGGNNTMTLNCTSRHPVTLVPIVPNAPYRENTYVISAFYIRNASSDEYTLDKELTARFKVYKPNGEKITEQSKAVIVPGKDENLVYFSWWVPTGIGSDTVTVCAELIEGGKAYNPTENNRAVIPNILYSTPDTQYEKTAPSGFSLTDAPASARAYTTWSEYVYENDKFVKKNYGIGIYKSGAARSFPATGQTAEESDDGWRIKSGYGVSAEDPSTMQGVSGFVLPAYGTQYLVPQYAYALLPEYLYRFGESLCVTLTHKTIGSVNNWVFPKIGNVENVHYTPLWFPDGKYPIAVVQSDAWTPMGMLSSTDVINNLTVSGNLYEDWYVGR